MPGIMVLFSTDRRPRGSGTQSDYQKENDESYRLTGAGKGIMSEFENTGSEFAVVI